MTPEPKQPSTRTLDIPIFYLCCFLITVGTLALGCLDALWAHQWGMAVAFGLADIVILSIFIGESR